MTGTPRPGWVRIASRLRRWDPETTRRTSWGAVVVIACALLWPVLAPGGEVPTTPTNPPVRPDVAAGPSASAGPDTHCPVPDPPPEPTPAGLAAVSTSVVGRNAIVESIRWARTTGAGLWGVAAVAECGAVRVEAVWVEPDGQRRRHDVSEAGRPVTGVVADGPDGTISVYTVRGSSDGAISAVLHISTDRGTTWQERAVPRSAEQHVRAGVLPPSWRDWSVPAT